MDPRLLPIILRSPLSRDPLWRRAQQVPAFDIDFTRRSTVDRINGIAPAFGRAGSTKLAWGGTQFDTYAVDQPAFQLAADGVWEYLHDEPAATNLLLWAACNSNWFLGGGTTVNASLGLNALGVFTGYSHASAGATWQSIRSSSISVTSGTQYAFTFYYRAGTSGRCRIVFRNNTGSTESFCNGPVGALSVVDTFAGVMTITSQTLMPDGLSYRITGTITPNATSADYWLRIGPDTATVGQTIIALGAQLEPGPIATSFILSTGSTATRAADIMTVSGAPFTSFYNQAGGVIYAECTPSPFAAGRYPQVFRFSDGTANNAITGYSLDSANRFTYEVKTTNVAQVAFNQSNVVSLTAPTKLAVRVAANDTVLAVNGALSGADSVVALPTVNQMSIGNQASPIAFRRLAYFPPGAAQANLLAMTT